ncbi:MAG: DUF5667 domain-containing protein [Candidatus Wildermuthbacteria bacterium]|nr:DUF5667 domain-containing protein [Candidatus Wildermuthbacteria bacterium]
MVIYFLILSLFFAGPVLAEEPTVEVPENIQQAIEEAAEKSLQEEQMPEEVKMDTEIKAEDLGVKEAKVLPGSFFYGFKNFFRTVRETVTLDPVKKAELQLQHTNEKIIEAQQLVEKDGSEKAAGIAAGVIEGINKDFEKIVQQGENLKKAKNQDKVEKFLDKIADQSLKQQIVLQKLQGQVPETAFARIEEARQEHLTRFGEVMTKVAENPQEFAQRLPRIIENRKGSDFKELKSMEILRDLEDKVPEDAKEALRTAQTAISQKFEQRFAGMSEETRTEKFQNYVEFMPGNAVRQFEAFDVMRQNFQSPEMAQEMEIAKDKAIQKFESQLGQFQGEEARQAFMAPWTNGDPQSLRTMTEIDMRTESASEFQPFQQFQQEAQNNFKERFGDNPEQLRQNPVFQRMESKPDIVDLKMTQQLGEIPAFKQFQNQAADKFIENVSSQPAGQGAVFGPPVPGGLKVLQEIKNQIPFQAQQGIDRAIAAQTQTMEKHFERIDDPQMFEKYKGQIEGDANLKRQVEQSGGSTFFRKIEEKGQQMEMIEQKNEERKLQKMEEINQQLFTEPQSGENGQIKEDVLRTIKPEIRQEAEQFRKNAPSEQQPILKPQPIQPGQFQQKQPLQQQPFQPQPQFEQSPQIPQNQPSIQNIPLSQPSAGGTQSPPPMPAVQPAP